MNPNMTLQEQLSARFHLQNNFTPEIINSFRVCVFPLPSTPISIFVNLLDQLRSKHKYITYSGKKIPIVYYVSSSHQISELKQYFNTQTRVEEENISVKQVPCLQISPAEANLAIQNLNKYISGIEVVKQANDIYYQFARVKLYSSEYNATISDNAKIINSIGLDLQYLSLEDLAAGDIFPNIINMHGYIAVGAVTESYNETNNDSETDQESKNNGEQNENSEKQNIISLSENSSKSTHSKTINQSFQNNTDNISHKHHSNVLNYEQFNKQLTNTQFSQNEIKLNNTNKNFTTNNIPTCQSNSIANTQTIGLSKTSLSDVHQNEISVAKMRKHNKSKEHSQRSQQFEYSQQSNVYNGKLEKRIAELQHEFLGIIDIGTDPGRLGRGWARLAVIDARNGEVHEDQRAGWPSDWPAGLDRFGLIHPGVLAACTVLYGLLETRWPHEAAAALRAVDMHPTQDPQSPSQLMSMITNQLSQIYQIQQSIFNYVMPQQHLSKRHGHKMTFFEAGRAGFHFRDYFYPLHIYKKCGLQYMANTLGKYQLKTRNHGQVAGDDEQNPSIMIPLTTAMDSAHNEASIQSMQKGIPYNMPTTKYAQIQLQQNNSIFQTRTNLHEITYPYTKAVPLSLRKLRVVYQIALDSVLFGFQQQAIEIFNYIYYNANRQDPSLAFLSLFFKYILKQVTNPWKMLKGIDYLVTEGFIGVAFNVLHCTQYTLQIPCQEIAFKVLEFQKLQQFNFLTQNSVFCFFLLYHKLLVEQSQQAVKNIKSKAKQQQSVKLYDELRRFLTAFKLIGAFQLFNKPVINRHETTLLQILIYNLHIIGYTPRDFIDYLVKDMNANQFYQFQQTQLFSVFINNKTLIEYGFYMQVFERPTDQGMMLKHIIQSNDHEDMNLNLTLSTQLNYVTEKLQKLQTEEVQQENSSKKSRNRQNQNKKKSEISSIIKGQKHSIENIYSPSMTQDAKLNNEQYDQIQRETRQNCIPIQILQPSSSGVEGQFECLKYDFNDVRCRFEISQKVKNEWNNVKAVITPQACRLQSQINAFKRNEINQFQYQSISNKNTSFPQIFLGLPIQLQLSLDHELDVQYLFPYASVTQLEFNYPVKTQIISQYFDSYSHSLILDVEFSLVNEYSYKEIIEQNEPIETCGFSIELCQDVKPLQTIIEPKVQDMSVQSKSELKTAELKLDNYENRSDEDILDLEKEKRSDQSLSKNCRDSELSQIVTEEFSISNDLLGIVTTSGPPNFVCELFELKTVTMQINSISFSTTNIQNAKFILYNQYTYLNLQGVQSINYMQFEEQFGYQFINVDKQEWCKGNLLVFEFQCTYHNLKDFMINTERNVYLFSDMGEQIGLEERTFNPEETEKMNKFRRQSIFKSNLIQTSAKHLKHEKALGNVSEHRSGQNQLQLLSLIDKVTKDKLYLVILASQQKPSFCFNFREQVLKVQLFDYSETLLSSQLTMEPYAHLYNGSFYSTTLINVYNNLNKLVMHRDPHVTLGLVFLAQNETASSEPHGLQGPQIKQHFRDAVAELGQKDFVIEKQDKLMTLKLSEKLKNMVESFQPVVILNMELHGCSITGIFNSVITPDFSLTLKVSKSFHVVLYIQFNGIDLIKEIILENKISFE